MVQWHVTWLNTDWETWAWQIYFWWSWPLLCQQYAKLFRKENTSDSKNNISILNYMYMIKFSTNGSIVSGMSKSRSSSVVESLPLMREAWVQSSASTTKALEQSLDLCCLWGHISMVPQLAKLNSLYCKELSYVGGPIVFPLWKVQNKVRISSWLWCGNTWCSLLMENDTDE